MPGSTGADGRYEVLPTPKPAGAIAVAARGETAATAAPASRGTPMSMTTSVLPIWITSPARSVALLTGCPFTRVPEPRSII